MKILSFDTSNNLASVAIVENQKLLAYNTTEENSQQAEKLFLLIEESLNQTGFKLSDIDLISVTNGPGSFTGVRIGLAAALGLKFAVKAKLIALSNFQIIAWEARNKFSDKQIAVSLDARRGQVYYQLFDTSLNNLTPPSLLQTEQVPAADKNTVIIDDYIPNAKMLSLATSFFYEQKLYSELEPLYIREPDVLMPKASSPSSA